MCPTTVCCRLCLSARSEFKTLVNESGQYNEVYEIAAKYFDPMLLTTIICMECWRHINEFNEFQQSVLEAQTKLNDVEIEPLIKLEMIPLDQDVDNYLKEDMNMPVFDSVDNKDCNPFSSDDETPISEFCSKEIREFTSTEILTSYPKCEEESFDNLAQSLNVHQGEHKFKCTKCDRQLKSARGLREHTTLQHGPYQCPHCPQKFKGKKNIPRHIKLLHPKELAEYNNNRDKEIKYKQSLSEQTTVEDTSQTLYQCPHCPQKFKANKNIPRHIKHLHPKEFAMYNNIQSRKPEVDVYSVLHDLENSDPVMKNEDNVDATDEASIQEKTLEYDTFIAKWKQELECDICKSTFTNFHLLFTHFKQEHPSDNCHVVCCENKHWSRPDIVEHILHHLNPNTFKCKICGKCCKNNRGLNNHVRNVHSEGLKERQFECEVCHKRFHKKDKLMLHFGTHSTERLYFCKVCDKGFSTVLLLKKHKHTHNSKRICEQCGKSFQGSSALKQHLLEHDGIKKPDSSTVYKCSECGKIYSTKVSLYQHKRNVHGDKKVKDELERKFKCTICHRGFKYAHVLREHTYTHSDTRSKQDLYQCPHCPTKFKQKRYIRPHLKTLHPEEFADSIINRKNLIAHEIVI